VVIIILVSLDILFLILLACCVSLDRRLDRLVKDTGRRLDRLTVKTAECRSDIDSVIKRLDKVVPPADADESKKQKLAEKRFTDGIASILAPEHCQKIRKDDGNVN
jgi:hypothetical protein